MFKPKILLSMATLYSVLMLLLIINPLNKTGAVASEITVDLATTPESVFFELPNLAPGDWTEKILTVKNKGNVHVKYSLESEYKGGNQAFYNLFNLEVKDSNGVIYSGKLKDLSGLSVVRPLASLGEEQLLFKAELPYETGNEFQGEQVKFDLVLKAERTSDFCVGEDCPPLPCVGSHCPDPPGETCEQRGDCPQPPEQTCEQLGNCPDKPTCVGDNCDESEEIVLGDEEIPVGAPEQEPEQDLEQNPEDEENEESSTDIEVSEEETPVGGEIPKTAVPWYNLLVAASLLLIASGMFMWRLRKRID